MSTYIYTCITVYHISWYIIRDLWMIQIIFRYHAITAKLIQSILNIQVPEILVQIENWYIQLRFNFSLCCSYICTSGCHVWYMKYVNCFAWSTFITLLLYVIMQFIKYSWECLNISYTKKSNYVKIGKVMISSQSK